MSTENPVSVLDDCPLETLIQSDTVIEGGHYIVGETVDPLSEWSWEVAVKLYSQASRLGMRNIGLELLIEDFAVRPSERERYRASYRLPAAYRTTLNHYRVDPATVTPVWEVQLRNRAQGDLRRRLKPHVHWNDDGYFIKAQNGIQRRITYGTVPTCNFIMARHIAEKGRRFKRSLNVHDIKWECQSNGGVTTSRPLYGTQMTVINAYVTPNRKIGFIVQHQERESLSPSK
jgi:hypothetical protein